MILFFSLWTLFCLKDEKLKKLCGRINNDHHEFLSFEEESEEKKVVAAAALLWLLLKVPLQKARPCSYWLSLLVFTTLAFSRFFCLEDQYLPWFQSKQWLRLNPRLVILVPRMPGGPRAILSRPGGLGLSYIQRSKNGGWRYRTVIMATVTNRPVSFVGNGME